MSERRLLRLLLPLFLYYGALGAAAWLIPSRLTLPVFADRSPGGAAVAMLGALALMAPVAWMYMRTKSRARYDASLVQTIVVLPVVIAGVVLIVRDSVALAFSLAGIVAAVRFRNTLRDTKDAVYIFLAIAVGLAAGVQGFSVGFVVCVIYIAVMLVLWRFDVGAVPVADRVRGRLIVELPEPASAEPAIAELLQEHARRWKLLRSTGSSLVFTVQLRRRATPDALLAALRAAPAARVSAARFEPLDR